MGYKDLSLEIDTVQKQHLSSTGEGGMMAYKACSEGCVTQVMFEVFLEVGHRHKLKVVNQLSMKD